MFIDRHTAAVVGDRDASVYMNLDPDLGAMAGHGLIDGIIDDLEDKVMETALGSVADVHARALANAIEPLEHLYLVG